ncbi:hypothetical protein [Kitasatospora sp. NPDC047058]|uniref:hypothetical protein n=1 Tax=Kitasatospora sp. NPDC047058 TaxID=3155620 RepID=UPI0033E25302
MNRFARSARAVLRPTARTIAALARGPRALGAAVVRLDARAEAVLRSWARPLTVRLGALLRRLAAANCDGAMTRHLLHRDWERGRGDGPFGDDGRTPRNTA